MTPNFSHRYNNALLECPHLVLILAVFRLFVNPKEFQPKKRRSMVFETEKMHDCVPWNEGTSFQRTQSCIFLYTIANIYISGTLEHTLRKRNKMSSWNCSNSTDCIPNRLYLVILPKATNEYEMGTHVPSQRVFYWSIWLSVCVTATIGQRVRRTVYHWEQISFKGDRRSLTWM